MKRAELDPALHCRHATKAAPHARQCWSHSREDPCAYCRRVEAERVERARAWDERDAHESYYEHLVRTQCRHAGLFARWALDLYEQANRDVEGAVALIAASDCYPEDVPLIEAHVRLMPAPNREHVKRWGPMLDEVRAAGRST